MRVNYCTSKLSNLKHVWHQIIKLADIRDFNENLFRLKELANKGAVCVYALDGGKVVGTYIFTGLLIKKESVLTTLHNLNIKDDEVLQGTFVFVHKDYRGNGIAKELYKKRDLISKELGFKYSFINSYDTDNIKLWTDKTLKFFFKNEEFALTKLGEYQ